MWPGFGENMRVLEWIIGRCQGQAGAIETAIGQLPRSGDLNLDGLDIDPAVINDLLSVDKSGWRIETEQIRIYLEGYGGRLPAKMLEELEKTRQALD